MAWEGIDDGATDVGPGWDMLENATLYVKGECRRRPGFGGRVNLSSAVVRTATELGNYAILATAAGSVLSVTQSTGSVASLATGLNTTNWPTFASVNGRMYYANGVDTVRVTDDGTNFRAAGITAPSTAAVATITGSGGVVDIGTHLVRYRYYDSTRNRLSDPSEADSIATIAGNKILITFVASGDATVDKIIVEMTPVDAETYYRVATVANSGTTYTIDIADSNLILNVAATRDGEFHHQPPPVCDILCEHRQRVWTWKISTSLLCWSRAGFPESFDSVNTSRTVTLQSGDAPKAMMSYFSDLYLFGSRSIRRLVYTSDPSAAMIVDVPGNYGVFNARCVLKIDGGMMVGWGKSGAWIIDAMQPKKISKPIGDQLEDIASVTALDQRFIAYEPVLREIYFFFPLSGSTTCKAAYVYSLDTEAWTLAKYRQGFTAATLNSQYIDRQRAMWCDENGYAWRVGVSINDGVDDGRIIVTSGTTSTVINGINLAQAGQILYDPIQNEERLITVATGSTVTVSPAFTAAPSVGTTIYAGSIRYRLVSNWITNNGIDTKNRPTKLMLAIRPYGSLGSVQILYYQDFGNVAVPATSFSSDTFPQGVSIVGGILTVNLDTGATDGYVPVPMPSDWVRAIKFEIISETPLNGIRYVDVSLRQDSKIVVGDE